MTEVTERIRLVTLGNGQFGPMAHLIKKLSMLLSAFLIVALVAPTAPASAATTYPGFSSRGIPLNGQTLLGSTSSCTSTSQDPTTREAQLGTKFGIHRTYWRANQQSSALSRAKSDLAAGRLPWVSFKPPYQPGTSTPYTFKQMSAGAGDAWARDMAAKLGSAGGPVWVAVFHEPESERNKQDLQYWKAMQKRLSPIFRAYPNIAYTVVFMGYHQFMAPTVDPKLSMSALWPGTQYVDVTGFDPYNLYGTKDSSGKANWTWRELKDYYTKFASWSAANGGAKWAVSETGYTDAAATKDVKWMSRSYDDMKRAGGVALAYWDCTKSSAPSWAFKLDQSVKRAEFKAVLTRSNKITG